MARRPKKQKAPKATPQRPVNYLLISPLDNGHEPEPYKLLKEVRAMHHGDTQGARVALAWRLRDAKPDKDGHMVLGKCVKSSDLTKEFMDYDFVIVLNKVIWDDQEFDRKKKVALLDHELCHIAPDYDGKTGEHKRDERNRLLFRVRKHEIEEFVGVVERHGCYKHDLELFAKTILRNREPSLFQSNPPAEGKPLLQ